MDDRPLQMELRIFDGDDRTPCADCHAGCCRSFVVPLTGPDVIRIERATGLSFWDFAARWDDCDGAISRGIVPHFRFDDQPGNRFVIGLLHKPSDAFPGATRCRFLHETLDEGGFGCASANCAIYGNRPVSCRIFPATIDAGGNVRGRSVPEFGRPEAGDAYRLCPRDWDAADFDADQVRRDLARVSDEMQQLHVIAERWNRELRPWTSFPAFLQLLYGGETVPARRAA